MRARSENFLASYLFGPAAAMVLVLISGFGHLAGAGCRVFDSGRVGAAARLPVAGQRYCGR